MSPVLSVHNLSKRFGGIVAVDGVSFEVNEGEILGIIGPNGSGKSTLFNCILGQLAPSSGEVRLGGEPITGMRACDLARRGLARTFQLLQVFPQLTVVENLILAGQEHQGTLWSRLMGPPDAGLSQTAAEMITFFRLDGVAGQPAGSLSYGQQKLLDAAMVFMARPRLVLLEEPAAGLDEDARGHLRECLRAINAQAGATFVIIDPNLDFVTSLATRLLVLAGGRVVAAGDVESVLRDAGIQAYFSP
jgi:branched-chain amino acid transport system ATP-binding protein